MHNNSVIVCAVTLSMNLRFQRKYEERLVVYLHNSAKAKVDELARIMQKCYFITSLPSANACPTWSLTDVR